MDGLQALRFELASEPLAGRILLRDPEALEGPSCSRLAEIIDEALRWSVLQTPGQAGAYLPKHRSDRHAIGVDINPVAVALTKGKSAVFNTEVFRAHAQEAVRAASHLRKAQCPYPEWLDYWFTGATLQKLLALRMAIDRIGGRAGTAQLDALRAALIVCVRKCSRADPRSPKPFISKRAREKRLGKPFDSFHVFQDVTAKFADSTDALLEKRTIPVRSVTLLADARTLKRSSFLREVDAVVTSPPYLSAQDYYRSSKLELAVVGMWKPQLHSILGELIIGSGRGNLGSNGQMPMRLKTGIRPVRELEAKNPHAAGVVRKYLSDMQAVLGSVFRIVKDNGRCCFIVGDCTMGGVQLPVHKWFKEMATDEGFRLFRHEVDTIRDRRLPPKRESHTSVIRKEHLLFFQKPHC